MEAVTLIADTAQGNRPSFSVARAELLCSEGLRAEGVPVQAGIFGARLEATLVNDGLVTITLDEEACL